MVTSNPETAATPLRPGDPRRLGRYELTGRLGSGGQGAVYLGTAPDGRHVAVKLLHAELAQDATARERFVREARAAMRVARFCTAQVLDADVEGDQPYLVSEYVTGRSLHALVTERGPITGAALDRLAIGTITALVAIHQAGIVHRDLKPGNVLIAEDGPRVIDFGIAKDLDAATTTTSRIVGTPAYMAPEQLSGGTVTPAVDIFAWGSMIAYVATGQAPFGMDTIPSVVNRIVNAEPDLGDLPDPMRSLVADCLAKDPARRPTARQVLLRLLGQQDTSPAAPVAAAAPPAPPIEEGVLAQAATIAATGMAGVAGMANMAAAGALAAAGTSPDPSQNVGAPPGPATTPGTDTAPTVDAVHGAAPLPAGARGRGGRRGGPGGRALLAGAGALAAAVAIAALALSSLDNWRYLEPTSDRSSQPATTETSQNPGIQGTGGWNQPAETDSGEVTTTPSEHPTGTAPTGETPHTPHTPTHTPPTTQHTPQPSGSSTMTPHHTPEPPDPSPDTEWGPEGSGEEQSGEQQGGGH